MPQHRHLTGDVAELLTCYEEIINRYHQFYLTIRNSQNQGYGGKGLETAFDIDLFEIREQAEGVKWRCISKGYCDIETGWHRRKTR